MPSDRYQSTFREINIYSPRSLSLRFNSLSHAAILVLFFPPFFCIFSIASRIRSDVARFRSAVKFKSVAGSEQRLLVTSMLYMLSLLICQYRQSKRPQAPRRSRHLDSGYNRNANGNPLHGFFKTQFSVLALFPAYIVARALHAAICFSKFAFFFAIHYFSSLSRYGSGSGIQAIISTSVSTISTSHLPYSAR